MLRMLTVPLSSLCFDEKNPRLPEELPADQNAIFRYLITEIGVEDLLASISEAGFVPADPIIVDEGEGAPYTVLEGNRRLAAMKLLSGQRPSDTKPLPKFTVASADLLQALSKIPVWTGWDPDQLATYLGYKHVTATREWSPEAKARFVLAHAKNDLSRPNLTRFARQLGTNYPTLRRWLLALLTLKQAEELDLIDALLLDSRKFGTYYTLLGSSLIQGFLGIQGQELTDRPIPSEFLEQWTHFLSWVFGTESEDPVVNSRKQKELEEVLQSPSAVEVFTQTRDLEGALMYTEYKSDQVAAKMSAAAYALDQCIRQLFDVRSDDSVKRAFEHLKVAYEKVQLNMGMPVA